MQPFAAHCGGASRCVLLAWSNLACGVVERFFGSGALSGRGLRTVRAASNVLPRAYFAVFRFPSARLARENAKWATDRRDRAAAPIDPDRIRIKVDDDGVGGGVVDQLGDFSVTPVSAAGAALDPEDYPNVRSELWFAVAERARRGRLSLARLTAAERRELKRQAMAPAWKLNGAGQRVVEPKDETKKKLGRSPDGLDALNLAYYEGGSELPRAVGGE